jgi:hypothetical protein
MIDIVNEPVVQIGTLTGPQEHALVVMYMVAESRRATGLPCRGCLNSWESFVRKSVTGPGVIGNVQTLAAKNLVKKGLASADSLFWEFEITSAGKKLIERRGGAMAILRRYQPAEE